ncbi:EscU/YscU/HrcU family type III secretion system export apparatus switch protein [Candidatus Latescibacterota bacterium]
MIKRRKRPITDRRAAAALRYKQGIDPAPRLVAKGAGIIAEKILQAAREANIPIHEDPDLLALLMTLNIDEVVSPEMYVAVAEVLAFIYRMNNRMPEQ